MLMKKGFASGFVFSLLSFLTGVFSLGLVSALDLRRASESTINAYVDFLEPFLKALLGGQDYTGTLLFEKLLVFIIFFSLVYLALMRVPLFEDKRKIIIIITIAVSLLGVRFIDFGWMMAIIMQYEVLAIALTSILPLIVYFFFLIGMFPGDANTFMRKIGWVFFIVVYAGLWSTVPDSVQANIFFWTMIVGVIFVFFDSYVEKLLHKREFHKVERMRAYQNIGHIDYEIRNLQQAHIPEKDKQEQIKLLEKQRQYWIKRT